MKATYIIGCLMLAGACLSCTTEKEDDIINITDKGQDIDDDKTLQTPDDQKPIPPGNMGDFPLFKDTIPQTGGETPPVQTELTTLYIRDHQVDSTLFAEGCDTINSHIVVEAGGKLQMTKGHIMQDNTTITIESEGRLWVGACIKQVDLTIKSKGILDIGYFGAIYLVSREHLHLEQGAIIRCNGEYMHNEALQIYAPSADPASPAIEKIDSTEIGFLLGH